MNALTPEQQRATSVFRESYEKFDLQTAFPVRSLNLDQVTISNVMLFVEGRINRRTLPHETHWAWNQSKSKVQFSMEDGTQVKFAKLNPRRVKSNNIGLPSYKLWVFEVESPKITSSNSIFFLWCEKGKASSDAEPPLVQETSRGHKKPKLQEPQQSTEEISVAQFAFLADFIDPEIASQLGWISPRTSSDQSPETQ